MEKAVANFEARFTTRALRNTAPIRRRLTGEILSSAVSALLPAGELHSSFAGSLARLFDPLRAWTDNATSQLLQTALRQVSSAPVQSHCKSHLTCSAIGWRASLGDIGRFDIFRSAKAGFTGNRGLSGIARRHFLPRFQEAQ